MVTVQTQQKRHHSSIGWVDSNIFPPSPPTTVIKIIDDGSLPSLRGLTKSLPLRNLSSFLYFLHPLPPPPPCALLTRTMKLEIFLPLPHDYSHSIRFGQRGQTGYKPPFLTEKKKKHLLIDSSATRIPVNGPPLAQLGVKKCSDSDATEQEGVVEGYIHLTLFIDIKKRIKDKGDLVYRGLVLHPCTFQRGMAKADKEISRFTDLGMDGVDIYKIFGKRRRMY
ncbi:hypothetical protein CEXT_706961 [Caerostris extrusa]|uniref:Uncharacterized protein n=1 Tax=Caerostris extrusa TaxID=172846 RepID=A0AAV4PPG8_CAEEX|nr:hypothetical protein CEXT_706961 [Caerostris extrusa]